MAGEAASSRRKRQPTQVDLARHAGVSQATVSQVINETPDRPARLNPETRQRVLDAVAELGYRVNPAARSLRGGRNRLLGLYTFESVFPVDQRDFYYPFLLGVEEEVARQGYDLVLFTSASAERPRRIFVDGVNRLKLADGAVLLGRHIPRRELAELVEEDFPFVFVGRRELGDARGARPGKQSGDTPLSYVGADYVAATRDMVRRFVDLGHRRIMFVRERGAAEQTKDRDQGFHLGMAEAGIETDWALVHRLPASGRVTAAELREWAAAGVTAILAEPREDDEVAASIEAAADELGLSIPEDMSVGLLGDPTKTGSRRDWTRFAIPRAEMGSRAVRLLIDLLNAGDDAPRQVLLACAHLPGETLSRPPRTGTRT